MNDLRLRMKMKIVWRIRTNSDLHESDIVNLLNLEDCLGDKVKTSDPYKSRYWFASDKSVRYSEKRIQVEIRCEKAGDGYGNEYGQQYSVYVGFNSGLDWWVAKHIFEKLIAPHCPFSSMQQIRYDGDYDEDLYDIQYASDLKKSPVKSTQLVTSYKERCHRKIITREDGTVERYISYFDKDENDKADRIRNVVQMWKEKK